MKTYHILPLILLLGGCAAMMAPVNAVLEFVGLVSPEEGVTAAGEAVSGLIYTLTGVSFTRFYDAFLTKRGLDNVKNVVGGKTGWKSTLWSLAAILVGTHTPSEAKAAPTT